MLAGFFVVVVLLWFGFFFCGFECIKQNLGYLGCLHLIPLHSEFPKISFRMDFCLLGGFAF